MKVFGTLYAKMISLSKHKNADKYLYVITFAESSFFPIPTDIMLGPMSLAQPKSALKFAFWTTIFSVLGGIVGYLLGVYLFEFAQSMLNNIGVMSKWAQVQDLFNKYDVWIIFIAGFTPIPYKLFTIGAGAFALNLPIFIISSLIGRGLRFFLVAWLLSTLGTKYEDKIIKYIEIIGWTLVVVFVLFLFYAKNIV
jgi:membrane protein YqaA with SNARE-associated domain